MSWRVVNGGHTEHSQAATWLQALLDAQGRAVGTVRTYAGRLALHLTWVGTATVDPSAPSAEQLASFARWLERTPSRKHHPGRQRRRAPDPKIVDLAPARSAATVEGVLAAAVVLRFRSRGPDILETVVKRSGIVSLLGRQGKKRSMCARR